MMNCETLSERDIPKLITLAQEIGWGYNEENWRMFFALGVVVGHRAEDGALVSSAAMIRYGESLRWLTSFIVSPRFQRRGLARSLWYALENEIAHRSVPVGLVSTTEGLPFYKSVGFEIVSEVHKYVRKNGAHLSNDIEQIQLRTALPSDLSAIAWLDELSRGVNRSQMLQEKSRNAKQAWVHDGSDGSIDGFACGVMEGELLCVGPVIAASDEMAFKLIVEVCRDHAGSVRLDLPSSKAKIFPQLENAGFQLERIAPVMSYGGLRLPPESGDYYALAAQALG